MQKESATKWAKVNREVPVSPGDVTPVAKPVEKPK